MILFIKKNFVFLPLLLISYILVLFILSLSPLKKVIPNIRDNTGGPGQSLLRFREAQKVKKVDILFIGSSHVAQGFDNRLFSSQNINTFNMGSGLQVPQNTFYLLKEYVPIMQPKTIVMEIYWDVLEYENGYESCIDITSNSPCSINMIKMNLSTKNFKVVNSMIANYISRLVYHLAKLRPIGNENEKYIDGGYLEKTHNDTFVLNEIKNLRPRKINIQQTQLDYLKLIICYCRNKNIPLLFVTTPVPRESIKNVTNYIETINTINSFVNKYDIKWINFNDEKYSAILKLNSIEDFGDATHLSPNGAKKFNKLFIEELKRIPFYPYDKK